VSTTPVDSDQRAGPGRETTAKVVAAKNAEVRVTWVHSNVTPDCRKTYCICGPNADAIRQGAERNGLPVDNITPISVPDRYFLRHLAWPFGQASVTTSAEQ
jgi:hypothetical protein